ncbi:hypothetical protein [Sphingomonas koreensis]|uniref:hypothetical protein n=1 Tax=Sphingomonas koreensis TaxID=93064 RepID=UPI0013DF7071|nr:hypothetical protein [Sphingomonas koreensis]
MLNPSVMITMRGLGQRSRTSAHTLIIIDVVDVDDDERWFVLDVQIINARYCAIDRKILVS